MTDLTLIKQSIKSVYPECDIYLFGSHAKNLQTFDSDIDLFLLFPDEIPVSNKLDIQAHIRRELAKIHVPADIIAYGKNEYLLKSTLTNHICSIVKRDGVLL